MYKLNKATFFRQIGEQTICYQTKRHKVFVFNSIVYDILDILRNSKTMNDIVTEISRRYVLQKDDICEIEKCISLLNKQEILVDDRMNDYYGSLENKINANTCFGDLTSVLFELTYRCSEKCKHCYVVQSPENELSTEKIKQILAELRQMNVTYVTFTGGEPFLRTDFIEILKYAYDLGFVIDIFTNGISIRDEQFFEVAECCPRYIHFSIYHSDAQKHDSITQVKGSFERTINAIKKFQLLGIAVNIKTVIMKENCDDIENIITLAKNIGVTVQIGASISPKNDSDKTPISMRVDEEKALEKALRQSRNKIEKLGNLPDSSVRDVDASICGAGINNISINPQGTVFPCNALLIPIGDVNQSSINEIWNNSSVLLEWRRKKFRQVKGCTNCEDIDFCGFCPGTAMTETGDPLMKYEEACRLAKIKAKISREGKE